MTLEEFRINLIDDVKAASSENSSETEEFVNRISEMLIEAEEINDSINYVYFESKISRKKIHINGYEYNELDNILTLYIVPTLSREKRTLTLTEAKAYFENAQNFIELADKIKLGAEESSPAFGLAVDLTEKYNIPSLKYRILLLTDMVMGRSINRFDDGIIKDKPVSYSIWDINRLYSLEKSSTGKEEILIDLRDFTDDSCGVLCTKACETTKYTAYLCNIPGLILAKLYNKYGSRLLEGNVRSFLQAKRNVNKQIAKTIYTEPNMFFAYNNGITVTASDIEINQNDGGSLYIEKIKGMQIVNGGQTTASLGLALFENKQGLAESYLRKIFVPMKLAVMPNDFAQEVMPQIARYANTQNPVNAADFCANHPFHIKMEDYSRRILAPASMGRQYQTHWYYERARGQYKQATYKQTEAVKREFARENPKSQLLTKVDLAKYQNIFDGNPHLASAGGQKSFVEFSEKIARMWESDDSRFNEAYFKKLIAKAILYRESDKLIKETDWGNGYKANTIAYTLALIADCVRNHYPDKIIDFMNIWKIQGLTDAWKRQILVFSKKVYYDLLNDKERTVDNISEWAKKNICWDKAKNMELRLSADFVDELINEEETIDESEYLESLRKEISDFGIDNWKLLLSSEYLTTRRKDILQVMVIDGSIMGLNKIQCETCLNLLEKARNSGFSR